VKDNRAGRKRELIINLEGETEGNTTIKPELTP
jgi:hypothetical protein